MQSRSPIRQEELEVLIGLKRQIHQLRRLHKQQAGDILDRLMAGATVEAGAHSVELFTRRKGSRQVTSLLIF